jgi:hypothetical protein
VRVLQEVQQYRHKKSKTPNQKQRTIQRKKHERSEQLKASKEEKSTSEARK